MRDFMLYGIALAICFSFILLAKFLANRIVNHVNNAQIKLIFVVSVTSSFMSVVGLLIIIYATVNRIYNSPIYYIGTFLVISGSIAFTIMSLYLSFLIVLDSRSLQQPDKSQAQGASMSTLAACLSAVALIASAQVTVEVTRLSRDQLDQINSLSNQQINQADRLANDQLQQADRLNRLQLEQADRLTQEQLFSARYTKALDWLSTYKPDGYYEINLRTQGVQELGRLAYDSQIYRVQIVNLLMGYIRVECRKHQGCQGAYGLREEVQSAIKVLIIDLRVSPLNLSHIDLDNIDLSDTDLTLVDLEDTCLCHAKLSNTLVSPNTFRNSRGIIVISSLTDNRKINQSDTLTYPCSQGSFDIPRVNVDT